MKQTSRIGPFALEELLPDATSTYSGIHVEQRRSMAIKLFSAPFGTSREARMAFALEWEKLKVLRHPHVVRCFGGGMDDMRGYLVYELIAGESVSSLLKRRGHLGWDQVVELSLEIVSGLEFLHENEVHHLALAPEKLLLPKNTRGLKIADLRFERHKNLAFQSSATITPARAAYMAPEQFRDDAQLGPKTDMYGLGCVMYAMLAGRPPFNSKDVNELARMHRTETPERVSRLALDCPIWLEGLVQQLLEKDPHKRPFTMSAVRLALEETQKKVVEGISVAEHVTGGLSALKKGASRREAAELLGRNKKKRKKYNSGQSGTPFYERAWFLALCLVLLVLLGAWFMWPPSEEKLYRRAVALLDTGSDADARRAREDFLEPMLRRFPEGKYAEEAQQHIDRMDMKLAEVRLRNKLKLRRELGNEGERLLAEAWEFQQFGDSATALKKFQSMADILPKDEKHRPYRNIALREIELLENEGVNTDRKAFLDERLRTADQLAAEGKHEQATLIWRSIISLYRAQEGLEAYVDQAYKRLDQPPSSLESEPASEPKPDVAS